MEYSEFITMNAMQDQNWWYIGRKKIISSVLTKFIKSKIKIADVACGSGVHLAVLQNFGEVVALERNEFCLQRIHEDFGSSIKIIPWTLPEEVSEKFDLLVLTDVLEHLPDEAEAVKWMAAHLSPKGKVLITVPAHMFLWSDMDEAVHHYRRYNKTKLLKLFQEEFEIQYCSYYNAFLFPVKIFFLGFSKSMSLLFKQTEKKSYNDTKLGPFNYLFSKILSFEASLIPRIQMPFGVALILLAQKKSLPRKQNT